jgi:hypothetical protein
MVGEPVVGVHIFYKKRIKQILKTVSYTALSGCLDTKKLTVAEADKSS